MLDSKSKVKTLSEAKKESLFNVAFKDYSRLVSFVISRYINNIEDIKDLTLETYTKYYANISKVENQKSYLTTSARNLAIDFLRKNKGIVINELCDEDLYIENVSTNNYKEVMEEFSLCLNVDEIKIINLYSIYGFSFKEISYKLNIKENTIKTQYHRALEKYKKWRKNNK
jgi:RNA polymerase sigma-70 factor (ECF subfamily)